MGNSYGEAQYQKQKAKKKNIVENKMKILATMYNIGRNVIRQCEKCTLGNHFYLKKRSERIKEIYNVKIENIIVVCMCFCVFFFPAKRFNYRKECIIIIFCFHHITFTNSFLFLLSPLTISFFPLRLQISSLSLFLFVCFFILYFLVSFSLVCFYYGNVSISYPIIIIFHQNDFMQWISSFAIFIAYSHLSEKIVKMYTRIPIRISFSPLQTITIIIIQKVQRRWAKNWKNNK